VTKVIGLTGGPCTGKTTVASFFRSLGAALIDADRIAHDVYRKDKSIRDAVRAAFGGEVFSGKRIDRKKLGRVVFKNGKRLGKLCRIAHPAIIERIKSEIARVKKPVAVLDAPLLMEAGLDKEMDYVAVVICGKKNQLKRSLGKGVAKTELFARISAQMPLGEKTARADFVINNNRSKRETKKEVEKIWLRLKRK